MPLLLELWTNTHSWDPKVGAPDSHWRLDLTPIFVPKLVGMLVSYLLQSDNILKTNNRNSLVERNKRSTLNTVVFQGPMSLSRHYFDSYDVEIS